MKNQKFNQKSVANILLNSVAFKSAFISNSRSIEKIANEEARELFPYLNFIVENEAIFEVIPLQSGSIDMTEKNNNNWRQVCSPYVSEENDLLIDVLYNNGRAKFTIKHYLADCLSLITGEKTEKTIPGKVIEKINLSKNDCENIAAAAAFCSKDPLRENLNGVFIGNENGKSEIAGCNGFALFFAPLSINIEWRFIIPSGIAKNFNTLGENVVLTISEENDIHNFLAIGSKNTISGEIFTENHFFKYPTYSKVIPENNDIVITSSPCEILNVLKQLKPYVNEYSKAFYINATGQLARFGAECIDEAKELNIDLNIVKKGNDIKIAFNRNVFEQAIKHYKKSNHVEIYASYNDRAVIIQNGVPEKILVMPVMLSE